ncbi:hypothetical protein KIM372_17180 [Bombiscardovia nodaiensis]|uniref:Twitching motility protein PilT n=1 Tax=Bombiscardovia nodaiensis TaxID=2932181 RepID=A0ABN6SFY1_9BIFI|nr:hypothetical protein KIM372_17180 [Bombiscardovia nodaiensis]
MMTASTSLQDMLIRPDYLIDSNCLVDPYNRYYSPDFRLSRVFWDKLKSLVQEGQVGLVSKVREEVYGHQSDQLDQWLDDVRSLEIECERSQEIVLAYQQVLQFVASEESGYQSTAIRDWAQDKVADPWLIGAAVEFSCPIVTFENAQVEADQPWKHPKIPTVAGSFGLQCVDLFDFMRQSDGF